MTGILQHEARSATSLCCEWFALVCVGCLRGAVMELRPTQRGGTAMSQVDQFKERREMTLEHVKHVGSRNVACRVRRVKDKSKHGIFEVLKAEAGRAQIAVSDQFSADEVRALTAVLCDEQGADFNDSDFVPDAEREVARDMHAFCRTMLKLNELVARLAASDRAGQIREHMIAAHKLLASNPAESLAVATFRLRLIPTLAKEFNQLVWRLNDEQKT
ncbi:MAG: hypothetical protein IT462_11480 [Planctomycetes bacterium]|nr:hypothetical protein [Planctomycetota bacterium]